jgi:hypothetical protein
MDFYDELRERIKTPELDEETEEQFEKLLKGIIFKNEEGEWETGISEDSEGDLSEEKERVLKRVVESEKSEEDEQKDPLGKYVADCKDDGVTYKLIAKGAESIVYKRCEEGDVAIVKNQVSLDPSDENEEYRYMYSFLVHLALYCFYEKEYTEDNIPIVAIKEIHIGKFNLQKNVPPGLKRRVVIIEDDAGITFDQILNDSKSLETKYHRHFCAFLETLKRFRSPFSLNHTDLHLSNIMFKEKRDGNLICKIIDLGFVCSFDTSDEREETRKKTHCNTRDEDVFQFIFFYCLRYFTLKEELISDKENAGVPDAEEYIKKLIPTRPMKGITDIFPIFGPILIYFLSTSNLSIKDRMAIYYGNNLLAFFRIYLGKPGLYESVKEELDLERLLPLCKAILKEREKTRAFLQEAFET